MPFDFINLKKQDEFEVDERGLATTASNLIRQAIKDLVQTEKSAHYEIDMGTWHNPYSLGKCTVCFAGAVMAQTLGANPNVYMNPGHFDPSVGSKLEALNMFRCGMIEDGVQRFYQLPDADVSVPDRYRTMVSYDVSPIHFKAQMVGLADELEAVGY